MRYSQARGLAARGAVNAGADKCAAETPVLAASNGFHAVACHYPLTGGPKE